jgi:putative ABC transport system permease protein
VDPGFTAAGVLKTEFQLPRSRYPVNMRQYPHFAEMRRFNQAVLADVAALPGVQSAALAGNHPLDAGFTNSFTVVGREAEARSWPEIAVRRVTPSYFRTLGVPLVRGRLIRDGDDDAGSPVLLLNEAAAARFFDGRDPLGQQIAFWGTARTIVGIVGNERFHGLTAAAPPAVYTPLAQAPSVNGGEVLLVRAAEPLAVAGAVERAVRRVDPGLALFGVEPLTATVAESIGQRRFVMLLLMTFAVVALLLAAIGIEGVLSYDVAERRREIGIRMALGGLPGRVMGLVMGRAAVLTGLGLAVGAAASLALTRLLRALLFEVSPADPLTYLGVVAVLAAVAAAASYVPARRAVDGDPMKGLREP